MNISFERIMGLEPTGYPARPSDLMNHVPTPEDEAKAYRDMRNVVIPRQWEGVDLAARETIAATRKWRWAVFLTPLLWAPVVGTVWMAGGFSALRILGCVAGVAVSLMVVYAVALSLTKAVREASQETRESFLTGLALLVAAALLGVALATHWPPAGWGH